MFFVKIANDDIAEVAPVTMQYPLLFIIANYEASDLTTIYFLLSKNPLLLERLQRASSSAISTRKRSKNKEKKERQR